MKRMLTVLTVVLVMAALLVVTAAPAFAACVNTGKTKTCTVTNKTVLNKQEQTKTQLHVNKKFKAT